MATKSMPNVKLNVQFTKATTLANIVSEENIVTSFGKLALWYDKLAATHAFTNNIGVSIATPGTSDSGKFLKADGTWATPTNTNTTYTLKGAYGSSSNTWVTTLTPSSGSATTSTVPAATTAAYGITKLSDTIADSSTLAATPKMVKSVNDKLGNYMLTSTYVGSDGLILPAKLPSYVDDVIDGYYYSSKFYEDSDHKKEITGETGKIYVDLSTNATYRWSGTTWVNISNPLDADRGLSLAGGKIGHANTAVTALTTASLRKVAYNAYGHITASAAPTAADLTSIIGDASTSAKGVMTTAQVTKLNGIDTGAEVNQNAFSNIKVGDATVAADSKTDTITFSAGNFVTLTGDASNDTVTFAVKQMTGATASAAGTGGAVPAPAAGKQTSFLRGDGTWVVPTNTDTKVTITNLAASTAAATYYPTFAAAAGTSGVNIINTSYNVAHTPGTTSAIGNTRLTLGNATASGTANNEEGKIILYSSNKGAHTIATAAATADVTHTFPATGGTVLNTGTTSFTQTLTSGTAVGTIKINGTSTTIYAPTNTDTHWTSSLITGASATAKTNAAATNGNVWMNLVENGTIRNTHNIVGAGSATVVCDANGKITISSANTNTTYTLSGTTYNTDSTAQIVTLTPSSGSATTATVAAMTGATADADGKAGLVTKPTTADTGKFLMGNGTWHDCICPDDVVTVTCIA